MFREAFPGPGKSRPFLASGRLSTPLATPCGPGNMLVTTTRSLTTACFVRPAAAQRPGFRLKAAERLPLKTGGFTDAIMGTENFVSPTECCPTIQPANLPLNRNDFTRERRPND
jgi:hypothetical protein